MDFTLNDTNNLGVTLEDVESLGFDLDTNDHIDFDIQSSESLVMDLSSSADLDYSLSTPSVIDAVVYDGSYEVTPKTYSQTLDTAYKMMQEDVTVLEIPYFETSNDSDGITVYIANTLA